MDIHKLTNYHNIALQTTFCSVFAFIFKTNVNLKDLKENFTIKNETKQLIIPVTQTFEASVILCCIFLWTLLRRSCLELSPGIFPCFLNLFQSSWYFLCKSPAVLRTSFPPHLTTVLYTIFVFIGAVCFVKCTTVFFVGRVFLVDVGRDGCCDFGFWSGSCLFGSTSSHALSSYDLGLFPQFFVFFGQSSFILSFVWCGVLTTLTFSTFSSARISSLTHFGCVSYLISFFKSWERKLCVSWL